MVNRLSDSDNRLLRAWRRGELDEDHTQSFEERLFFDPALAEAANIDMALEAGLRASPPLARPTQTPVRPRRRLVELLAAAAVGAMAVLPLTMTLAPQAPQPAGASIEWVGLSARRDLQSEPQLVAPRAGTGMVAIELAVAAVDGTPVAVRLDGAHGGTVLQAGQLQVRDGAVTFAFARDAVPVGVHSVEVFDLAGNRQQAPLLIRYQPR
jgi:hypothetical protein